jgi:uncharacterized Zn-binding protein involved in type VI secretion
VSQPAAKKGDQAVGVCTHVVMVPQPTGAVPTPLAHPFNGILDTDLSTNVNIEGMPAATIGSIATNTPPHIPTPPGVSFQPPPPSDKGNVTGGSTTVLIGSKGAARVGDTVAACGGTATIVGGSTVSIG